MEKKEKIVESNMKGFVEFLECCTLDGSILTCQIDEGKEVSITDQNKILIIGKFKKESPIKDILRIGDVPYFLKSLSLVGDNVKIVNKKSVLEVIGKSGKFSIELLENCANYVKDGEKSLKDIRKRCKINFDHEIEDFDTLLNILPAYKKTVFTVLEYNDKNLAFGLLDVSAGYAKQQSVIAAYGKYPKDWNYSKEDKLFWYDGELFGKVLSKLKSIGVKDITVDYGENVPIIVSCKNKNMELGFVIAPSNTI